MPLQLQTTVFDLLGNIKGIEIEHKTPEWLLRPGLVECRDRWPLVCAIYWELTGLVLPEVMPKNNWRRIDGVLKGLEPAPRIIEVDESQHFNCFRAKTLRLYPAELQPGFDRKIWMEHSQGEPRQKSGRWAQPKPPLFPGDGGRHRQRAFRDALADLLPACYGFLPTLRIADFEVMSWVYEKDACSRMQALLKSKIGCRLQNS